MCTRSETETLHSARKKKWRRSVIEVEDESIEDLERRLEKAKKKQQEDRMKALKEEEAAFREEEWGNEEKLLKKQKTGPT